MKQTLAITRKELAAYFGSPMALIFVGVFLAATLFVFFWVDTFFPRGIADVRPLFRWMPILTISLVAALTMRQWSEEQRSGTLEVLLTLPVSKVQLVLGKFLAVMALVALALALTLFLPITVSLMGNLDWGPVIGGYLAAFLMAAAYTAIGLCISSRTDNQIVALISTVLICGLLYLVGAQSITDAAGHSLGTILRALGSGSHFESIERGVIDLRDLTYYLSIAVIFLTLTVLSLDSKRWSHGPTSARYRRSVILTSALVIVNLVVVNLWLYPLSSLRLDLTAQKTYSLSSTTKNLIQGLAEPLTLRAYVSEKTHPLLAPLIPQLQDMLREYEIAGRGKVTAEVVDPATDPAAETEATQTYGIQPSPFQLAGRYESSVINAYFDVLVRYGDQSQVINFRDLIEVQPQPDGTVQVHFRNLEYDLTRAIKKAASGFQSVDNLLASLPGPAKLTLFATAQSLPEALKSVPDTVNKVGQDLASKSGGKFTVEVVDPDAPGAAVTRQQLVSNYKLRPISASLFSDQTYYLDMALTTTDANGKTQTQLIYPSGEYTDASVRSAIESALKRSSTGFLKVVGLWTPPETPTQNQFGQQQAALRTWREVRQQLSQDYTVQAVDLSSGQVPPEVDVLALVSPQNLDDKARYAIDQYLMRGGSVVVATSNYAMALDQFNGGLTLQPIQGGINDMLESYGVKIPNSLVMDSQNEPFPVPVERQVNGMAVQEIQALNYPFFADIRADGMDRTSPIVSKLSAVTLNWPSPVVADPEKNKDRQVTTLLKSSKDSWLRTDPNITPDLTKYPGVGFPVEGQMASQPLAVAVRGSFPSFFAGKSSPLASQPAAAADPNQPTPTPVAQVGGTIESSPDTTRLVVVGSSDFLTDAIFQVSSSLGTDRYLGSLQLLQNAVDWSAEDLDLLGIRARGTISRVLDPMTSGQERFWEGLNYGLALLALVAIAVVWRVWRRREKPMKLTPPAKLPAKDMEP
jgi:ABC-2 type transport system permease protein